MIECPYYPTTTLTKIEVQNGDMKRRKIRKDRDAVPRDSQGRVRKRSYVPSKHHPGWLDSLDSRLSLVKDLRERFTEICEDLGGAESLSYMQRSLVERGLWIEYQITQMERSLAEGGEPDTGKWTQAVNALQGLYARLGIERRARDVPDLKSYLRKGAKKP